MRSRSVPRPPLRAGLAAALAAAAALAGGAGCAGGGRPSAPPSVVLVLVDQLRADAVERWMPRVQALASEGVRFEAMRSAAPWTYPSVVSLFSGLYPQQHGADGDPLGGQLLATFDRGVPLLQRALRATHDTAAFVTNPFLQTWNPFHEGFDHYEVDRFIGSQGPLRGRPDLVWTERMFSDSVNAAVREHFDAEPFDRPEFVYVHYIDVHGPWDGAPFDARGADHRRTEDDAYATAARYVDERIAELHDYFLARTGGDLVFVVTSDHGQELGDDLAVGEDRQLRARKKTVHDFNTRIPFLLLPSDRIPAPRVVDAPCSNVDVAPTLLEWTGHAPWAGLAGRSLLGEVLGDPSDEAPRAIYSVHSAFGQKNDCVVWEGRKLMRHFVPGTDEVSARLVYELETDPREEHVAARTFGTAGSVLVEAAGTHGVSFPAEFRPPSDDDLEKMRGLGYFGGD